jgi:hypothetical protein
VDEVAIREAGAPFRGLRWLFTIPIALTFALRALRVTGRDPRLYAGPLVGVILVGLMIAVNFFDDVAASHVRRFGPRLLGLPVAWGVSLVELLLAPVIIVWGSAALPLIQEAARTGNPISGIGFFLWAARRTIPEEQRGHHRRFRWSSAILLAVLVAAIIGLSLTD